ncbi:hypothetical protein SAMN05518801_1447 [Novosphingobium sp. CF614]|uniref:hypothetical protein n=1 Tax=Novosphingobium sp. CF614 TaxID=1884364 RepID=UPI0008EBFAAD|nr:hypothetical protein [Novosphingobium sp. CF614]SFG53243.1 hypothetical protein SAMN05518801_1447 [Novosphingobium sp. CF614]
MITDRKAASERILGYAHRMRMDGAEARWTLGTFNGIELELAGYESIDDEGERSLSTFITALHHGENRDFELTGKTRPGTVVGRIESSIRNLDGDLAGVRANLEANKRRLAAFEARLGQDFPDTALLDDKLQELVELEADLATTRGEFERGTDGEAPQLECESDQRERLPPVALPPSDAKPVKLDIHIASPAMSASLHIA